MLLGVLGRYAYRGKRDAATRLEYSSAVADHGQASNCAMELSPNRKVTKGLSSLIRPGAVLAPTWHRPPGE
jgi:hypothetical protein